MTDKSSIKIHTLDTRGLSCPEPVMLLHGAIRDATIGEKVVVTATDPSTKRDIPKFCRFLGHELVKSEQVDEEFIYEIIKGA